MFEGLYDERAETEAPYPVDDWLSTIYTGEPVSRYRKGIGNLYGVGAYLFGGTDGSFMFSPRVDVDIAQNADLTLFGAMSFGDDDGQFVPGMYALTVRAKVYF